MNYKSRLFSFTLAATASLALMATTASATVISGSSSGYGVGADVGGLVNLNISPIPGGASGSAPGPYDTNDSVVSLDAGVKPVLNLTADVVSGHAQSNVDNLPGNRYALGESEIAGLAINSTLLSLTADTITSSAQVSGDFGNIDPVGSSMLANAVLKVAGLTIGLDANAAANTSILPGVLNPLGLSLVLNEQIVGGDGSSSSSLMVNALHLSFHDALIGLGLLNGDIIIGHSDALLGVADNGNGNGNGGGTTDVPAPGANWLFLFCGLLLIMAGLKKQRRTTGQTSHADARLITA